MPFTFENCMYVCPICGYSINIPDGTYHVFNTISDLINSGKLSPDDIKNLLPIIEKAQKEKTSGDDLRKIIEKEIPAAAGLTKFFTEGVNFPFILSLIIAALTWYYPRSAEPVKKERVVRDVPITQPSKRSTRRSRGKLKVSERNPNKNPK